MKLTTRTWEGHVMGTEAQLLVVTGDPEAGDEALMRTAEDLESTEQALSRFRTHSELSRLNRSGTAVPSERLLIALQQAIRAYEWSDGLLDPRVIVSLEKFGYTEGVPEGDVGEVGQVEPLAPVDMTSWVREPGKITLPPGVRLDLAGVGKALGIGWAAACLAGHVGLLVDVGGDIAALGANEEGEPWNVSVVHNGNDPVGLFTGSPLAIATSTTRRRAWSAARQEAHHLIDPRTGAPVYAEIVSATVAAPTILETDLAAKLLIMEGIAGLGRLDERYRVVVTDRGGRTEVVR